jgi:hypothetical protein
MFPFRTGASVGGWTGHYSESFQGSSGSVNLPTSGGIEGFVGFPFKMFFVDYSPSAFAPASVGNPNSFTYIAPLAAEFGITGLNSDGWPPLEVFVGLEWAVAYFEGGTQTHLSGVGYKVGADYLPAHIGKYHNIGVRFEYRATDMVVDNYGSVDVNPTLSTYYLGLVYVFQSNKKKVSDVVPEERKF